MLIDEIERILSSIYMVFKAAFYKWTTQILQCLYFTPGEPFRIKYIIIKFIFCLMAQGFCSKAVAMLGNAIGWGGKNIDTY